MKMILFVQDSLPSVYSDTMLETFMKEGMSSNKLKYQEVNLLIKKLALREHFAFNLR